MFKSIATRYTAAPVESWGGGLRLVFDIESDDLLDKATTVHCIVVSDLDHDEITNTVLVKLAQRSNISAAPPI